MLNFFAKSLLVTTSLSPVFLAIAIRQLERGESWVASCPWILAALILPIACWGLLKESKRIVQSRPLTITSIERNDQQMIGFLFVYLLPFIWSDKVIFGGQALTVVYAVVVTVIAIANASAFHFNPVLRALGFHFYTTKNEEGTTTLLISDVEIRRPGGSIDAISLSSDTCVRINP